MEVDKQPVIFNFPHTARLPSWGAADALSAQFPRVGKLDGLPDIELAGALHDNARARAGADFSGVDWSMATVAVALDTDGLVSGCCVHDSFAQRMPSALSMGRAYPSNALGFSTFAPGYFFT